MSVTCPKTHFDLMCELRPSFVREIEDAVGKHPPGGFALTSDEMSSMIGLDFELALFKMALAEAARVNLPLMGVRRSRRRERAAIVRTRLWEVATASEGASRVTTTSVRAVPPAAGPAAARAAATPQTARRPRFRRKMVPALHLLPARMWRNW